MTQHQLRLLTLTKDMISFVIKEGNLAKDEVKDLHNILLKLEWHTENEQALNTIKWRN